MIYILCHAYLYVGVMGLMMYVCVYLYNNIY